jgi:hypothetical protein
MFKFQGVLVAGFAHGKFSRIVHSQAKCSMQDRFSFGNNSKPKLLQSCAEND